ncbi:chitinase [Goodfellowiella coeruleoviolacea]|uniref:Glycosyl hydrolases family 18 n=1 Tax=Goodfellowiella coeruleoviolacea TaxID=334858 RepID=A0AAE3GH02_9PSEU|nr:chitinase [Goodfellowiella coeruleoviolacea]MCP2167175.1 Glycosyl hydrolases family 18 [Goodfellowiella coeruleoviolacea]
MTTLRRSISSLVSAAALALGLTGFAQATPPVNAAAVDPVIASPYLYLGWGSPPSPATVMSATGIKAFTMAFILSDGTCNPKWDGTRALTGGTDAATINAIRAAGGDVIVSFGGWAGNKLGEKCASASALAAAYQKVIDAYQLRAIDVDIENTEFTNPAAQDRVLGALKIIKQNNPGVRTVLTMGTTTSGPDSTGQRLIRQGAALGANVDVWSIMPFDFSNGGDMAAHTTSAAEGLKARLKSAFGLSDDAAYRRMGISSMNGNTDNAGEVVTLANFTTIRAYAQQHHLARLTFWSTNRDRQCGSGTSPDACSGITQQSWAFTKVNAGFTG